MKQIFSLLLIVCSFQLAGQNQHATVILNTGDTLYLEKFVQEQYFVTGIEKGTNKPRKISNSIVTVVIEGCKYERNEVDDMTGHFIQISQEEKLGGGIMNLELFVSSFGISKDKDTLHSLKFRVRYPKVFSIDADAKILIKCTDGKVYELLNLEYVIANCVYNSQYYNTWEGRITTPLTKELLTTLASNPVTKVRLYLNDGYVELDVKDKNQNNLMKVLRCMTSQ